MAYLPTGMKVKSAILFSIVCTTLSRPLFRNIPELVRTLHAKTDANGTQIELNRQGAKRSFFCESK